MSPGERGLIGFACSYTPLALIDAAGFTPYRLLPVGEFPERSGSLLHDNVCPFVKRILDRALGDGIPDLAGVVFMNSCDTMRRLADAWMTARPGDRVIIVDMPTTGDQNQITYFGSELSQLAETLSRWGEAEMTEDAIRGGIRGRNDLARAFESLRERAARGLLEGGRRTLQDLYNRSVTSPIDEVVEAVGQLAVDSKTTPASSEKVPVFLMGNVMPDPEAIAFFESCGVHVADEDLCTGSRIHAPIDLHVDQDMFRGLAEGLLSRPACARTFDAADPGGIASQVVEKARAAGAHGVIAYVMKFCDPYLARMPYINAALRDAGIPMLILEGDCTLRSLGQFRTRIEAFVEMLRT